MREISNGGRVLSAFERLLVVVVDSASQPNDDRARQRTARM